MVFVIHLPHQAANSTFVGFQGDPWISVHIDDVRPTSDCTIMPYEAMGTAISQLFLGHIAADDQFGLPMDQENATNANNKEDSDTEMDSRPLHRGNNLWPSRLPHLLQETLKAIGDSLTFDTLSGFTVFVNAGQGEECLYLLALEKRLLPHLEQA